MRQNITKHGFSLIEVLVALVTATLALIAVFAIYDRVRRASASITQKLDERVLPSEIMQKIAEDIDRLAGPGADAKITIANSFQGGFPAAQLTITSQILDKNSQPEILEKIVWQTDYDLETARLILYRSHSGLIWEDNMLDKEQRADWSPDRQLFVPMCTGLSYFKIQVPQPQNLAAKADVLNASVFSQVQNQLGRDAEEQKFYDVWNQPQLPPAVLVTLSFASPIEGRGVGGVEVPDELKIKRTIVIDRSKKMNFVYVPLGDANQFAARDANSMGRLEDRSQQGGQGQESYAPGAGGSREGSDRASPDSRRSRRFRPGSRR